MRKNWRKLKKKGKMSKKSDYDKVVKICKWKLIVASIMLIISFIIAIIIFNNA